MTTFESTDWKDTLERGLSALQNGEPDEAKSCFQNVLIAQPEQPDAFHGMGMAYAQEQNYEEAIKQFQRAIQYAPKVAEFHNNLANAYKKVGQINPAMQHYQEALRLKSPYPQAHNNLGNLLYQIGKFEEAKDHFQKSLRMAPDSPGTHFNLGICLIKLDRLPEAISHFEQVLVFQPTHLGAMHNLGIGLCVLKQFHQAKPLLEKVIEKEPNNIDARFHLGIVLSGLGQLEEAQSEYRAVLTLSAHHGGAHHNLATLYLHFNHPEKALIHYQAAWDEDPNNQTAKHMISALKGEISPEGAPLEYTKALFNQYAYSYDEHVKNHLHYRVPTLLRKAVTPYILEKSEFIRGLDLGCGTGLCAPLFTDVIGHLTGVDISENMIQIAQNQGGYHKLVVSDITSFLSRKYQEYEMIIAADVFVYFGELKTIFEYIHQALQARGLFCFSIEKNIYEPNSPFVLTQTGRYAHLPSYITEIAHQCRLSILSIHDDIIRSQDGQDVGGQIIVLQRRTE